MVKDETKRRTVPSLARLFPIHLVEHPVGEVAPSLEKEEPLGDRTKEVKATNREHHCKRDDGVDEADQSQGVRRDPIG